MIKITECPRDALQGMKKFIPTDKKIQWINTLLKVGYDILDFGSFVSPKVIPQLQDTEMVLEQLNLGDTYTQLLAIVPNLQGTKRACKHKQISFLGYPHSVSETFLLRNINSNIETSRNNIRDIVEYSSKYNKDVLVYISMCFGNIYGEHWNSDIVLSEIDKLSSIGIKHISLADTTGSGTAEDIGNVFKAVTNHFPDVSFNLHLHTSPNNWYDKVDSAYRNGCDHFDTVINGLGGCPLAASKLVGNLNTSLLLDYLEKNEIRSLINKNEFNKASFMAFELFKNQHN
ncbi:MAG: hypothetical protein ACEPOV_04250 [Hyphomicrobiales bacterium]